MSVACAGGYTKTVEYDSSYTKFMLTNLRVDFQSKYKAEEFESGIFNWKNLHEN